MQLEIRTMSYELFRLYPYKQLEKLNYKIIIIKYILNIIIIYIIYIKYILNIFIIYINFQLMIKSQ